MLHEEGLDMRVMLQNAKEFRSAIAAMSDDANTLLQLDEYSLL